MSEEKQQLINKILSLGGNSVTMPSIEEDLDELLVRGRLSQFDSIRMMVGRPSQCHENSALLWDKNRNAVTIVTGYALHGGMWYQHTWCERKDGVLVETTAEREAYFGFELTPEECEKFYFDNAW
jgi:hypothetical protein